MCERKTQIDGERKEERERNRKKENEENNQILDAHQLTGLTAVPSTEDMGLGMIIKKIFHFFLHMFYKA